MFLTANIELTSSAISSLESGILCSQRPATENFLVLIPARGRNEGNCSDAQSVRLETSGVALGNTMLDWFDCQAYVIGGLNALPGGGLVASP